MTHIFSFSLSKVHRDTLETQYKTAANLKAEEEQTQTYSGECQAGPVVREVRLEIMNSIASSLFCEMAEDVSPWV